MNKKTLFYSIFLVAVLIVVAFSATFAYLSVSNSQTGSNVLNTGCFDVSFNNESDSIILTDATHFAYPMSTAKGLATEPYSFTITNTCGTITNSYIVLNVKKYSDEALIPYVLYSVDGVNVNKLGSAKEIILPQEVSAQNESTENAYLKSYLIDSSTLSSQNVSKTYNLRLWIAENGENDLMGKTFQVEVMVYNALDNANTLKNATLVNLINDPSFENSSWGTATLDSNVNLYGNKSLKLTGANNTQEVTASNNTSIPLNKDHLYYARYEVYHTGASGSMGLYFPETESFFESSLGVANKWNVVSAVSNRSTSSTTGNVRILYKNQSQATSLWYDGAMLIDLTEAFGKGKEPSKEWCDENIPYFEGTNSISYVSEGIE